LRPATPPSPEAISSKPPTEFEDAARKGRQRNSRLLEGSARSRQAVAYQLAGQSDNANASWQAAEKICGAAGDAACLAEALNAGAENARLRSDMPAAEPF